MIVVDFSQTMVSTLLVQLGNHTNTKIELDLLRHMVLNCLRSYNTKFKHEYGEMILACDDKDYWRRDYFPFYKINRKRDRAKTDYDWPAIFDALNTIKQELRENFPYRVIQVHRAEADDIIATLCHEFGETFGGEPILILSGDKDFAQLQKYGNVKQYDPLRKRWITTGNPRLTLIEHIMKGDAGDGVPNVLSADDSIALSTRQKPLRASKLTELISKPPTQETLGDLWRNYKRNEQMISLDTIPDYIQASVLEAYEKESGKTRSHLFTFFMNHKLKTLQAHIQDF